jgi:hypothetical protein
VLATFDDPQGSPAVVKRRYGDGRVIFWYTAADVSWTDWPRNLSFLPVVNDMAWQLARSGSQGLHARVGDDIVFAPPPQLIDATSIALKVPAYPVEDLHFLKLDDNGPEKVVRYPAATQAGRYEMEFLLPDRTQQTVLFSRHVDPEEGNLGKATEEEIAATVAQPHTYHGELALAADLVEDVAPRKSYWWIFMVAVLAVLAAENSLARRFGHYTSRVPTAGSRPS